MCTAIGFVYVLCCQGDARTSGTVRNCTQRDFLMISLFLNPLRARDALRQPFRVILYT